MKLKPLALAALLGLMASAAQALTLQEAYQAALQNDPQYRMSFYDNENGKEYANVGRSNLLPQLSASYSASRNIVDQTQHTGGRDFFSQPRYISRSAAVQVRQTLFNLDAYARYRQGLAQTKESAARFEYNSADVIVRVVSAYADALYASDQLKLIEAQRDAYLEHMRVNKRLFEKGEGTKTDMLEVQARLDLAEAQVIEGRDAVKASLETLQGVVGMPVDRLTELSPNFRVLPLEPASFEDWRRVALESNPELKSARATIEVQQQEVRKAYAGHAPRVDVVGTYSRDDAASISTYQQDTVNRAVGIQINIPLYSGGQVSAVARQAVATRERARSDLDARTNKVLVELRKAHSIVLSSVAKVDALEKAVASGTLLVKATEQSIKGGVRINLDLLNAQQQLVTSQRDLAQARYSYLIGLMRVKAASGTLTAADIYDLSRYFQ
ncbi:TolC family outer membrane protein [Oxalobacteraceae bacterium OTU3CAMAD1]|nr:TolC family outer membrane protein [Oxalobacteraceae bacterium OTU3CAMAD1]